MFKVKPFPSRTTRARHDQLPSTASCNLPPQRRPPTVSCCLQAQPHPSEASRPTLSITTPSFPLPSAHILRRLLVVLDTPSPSYSIQHPQPQPRYSQRPRTAHIVSTPTGSYTEVQPQLQPSASALLPLTAPPIAPLCCLPFRVQSLTLPPFQFPSAVLHAVHRPHSHNEPPRAYAIPSLIVE